MLKTVAIWLATNGFVYKQLPFQSDSLSRYKIHKIEKTTILNYIDGNCLLYSVSVL